MTTVVKWSNVQVAIQSALAAADTITAITKASPGVASSTSHGMTDGMFAKITATGMHQVDQRVFRIDNAAANAFDLEGENTTAYDTFTAGTAEAITFGITMATAVGLTASGGDFDFIDITTIHDNVRKQVPGIASAASYSFECLWDPADTALLALKAASDNQSQRAIKFLFAGGQIVVFTGYVGCTLLPTGTAQDKVVTSVTLTMHGRPTIYAV
jgi:hypothetical protein